MPSLVFHTRRSSRARAKTCGSRGMTSVTGGKLVGRGKRARRRYVVGDAVGCQAATLSPKPEGRKPLAGKAVFPMAAAAKAGDQVAAKARRALIRSNGRRVVLKAR